MQALSYTVGIDEAVAGQDAAEVDRRCAPAGTDGFRQRVEHEPVERCTETRHQGLRLGIARRPVAPERRPAARLDGDEAVLLVQAEVVLGVADAHHDIADAQRRIEAARHAAEHQGTAPEAVEQQGRGDGGVDLARAAFDEDGFAAGDLTPPEGKSADLGRGARAVGEMGELLGQRRYDAQKPVCHG